MYKKKSLKFTYEQHSRDTRHAEALKARESSRFERLSMIRSINDSDLLCNEKSMESFKSVECEVQKVKKQPVSRLEMLFKWKQEKQLKKELEMKAKKKPFYVGRSATIKSTSDNKNLQTVKSSFIAQPNASFNASKAVKSKHLILGTTVQPSRIPNNSKQLASGTAFQSSRIPNSKQASSVAKSLNTLKKEHNVPTFPKKPTKAVCNPAISSINQTGSVPKALNNYVKAPPVKLTSNNMKVVKTNSAVKPINQGSFQLKSLSKLPCKPSQKAGTAIPKPATSIPSISKGISIQSKMPIRSMNQKSTAASKFHQKETCHSMEHVRTKGYCFKKAVVDSHKQQTGTLKKVPSEDAIKKPDEKADKVVEIKHIEIEPFSEQSLGNIPDLLFNSDISIIKPASFAPADFRFQPPTGMTDFTFDSDDPYEALEQVKLKFMSRTSTPTKPAEGNSSPKNCEKSPCSDSPFMDKNKSSEKLFNKSTDTSVKVSESVSPKSSLKDKIIVNKETNNETINQETYEEVVCDMATETGATDRECDALLKSSFNKRELFCDAAENEDAKENSTNVSLKIDSCESQYGVSIKNEAPQYTSKENSTFAGVLNVFEEQIHLTNSEDEQISKADILEEPDILKCTEKKPAGPIPKRVSILKSMSTLNAIAEASEIDECIAETPDQSSKAKQDIVITPRRSKRISSRQHILSACEKKTNVGSPLSCLSVTPRRSLRLQKVYAPNFEFGDSILSSLPFEEKSSKVIPRRSVRLIDLNTPDFQKEPEISEKDGTEEKYKSNLTDDFERLNLKDSENMDPNMLLMDFESPDITSKLKSKKVSLLYTPEKTRKSMRKSVRGDLIAFSPAN